MGKGEYIVMIGETAEIGLTCKVRAIQHAKALSLVASGQGDPDGSPVRVRVVQVQYVFVNGKEEHKCPSETS